MTDKRKAGRASKTKLPPPPLKVWICHCKSFNVLQLHSKCLKSWSCNLKCQNVLGLQRTTLGWVTVWQSLTFTQQKTMNTLISFFLYLILAGWPMYWPINSESGYVSIKAQTYYCTVAVFPIPHSLFLLHYKIPLIFCCSQLSDWVSHSKVLFGIQNT